MESDDFLGARRETGGLGRRTGSSGGSGKCPTSFASSAALPDARFCLPLLLFNLAAAALPLVPDRGVCLGPAAPPDGTAPKRLRGDPSGASSSILGGREELCVSPGSPEPSLKLSLPFPSAVALLRAGRMGDCAAAVLEYSRVQLYSVHVPISGRGRRDGTHSLEQRQKRWLCWRYETAPESVGAHSAHPEVGRSAVGIPTHSTVTRPNDRYNRPYRLGSRP